MDRDTSEIAKLTERISKDPKSKLFVPLAEEYKKIGDIEMSIHVLTEGLRNNPGYLTARSFLGRLLMETGDLAGAQKEFEEVIKAIPDNLLAQRKLGDIYALEGRPHDALARYQATVALNPKDQETIALIADLEAGRDVKGKIAKPGFQPPAEQAQKPDQHIAPPAAPAKTAIAAAKPAAAQAVKAGPSTGVHPAPGPEIAEEVLVVEPLEPARVEQRPPAAGPDFLAEREQGPFPAESREAAPNGLFEDESQVIVEPQSGEEPAETEVFAPAEEEPGVLAESLKKADDFTTDTLAELYISQGFYEKAIDIYERMLADNPGNRKLKDKLTSLHALANESGAAETEKPREGAIPAFEAFGPGEAGEDLSVAPSGAGERQYAPSFPDEPGDQPPFGTGLDLGGTAEKTPFSTPTVEAREYVPPPSDERDQAPSFGGGFDLSEREPVEFVPPAADDSAHPSTDSKSLGSAPAKSKGSSGQAAPKTLKDGRKETLSRLEQWLKNLDKEK